MRNVMMIFCLFLMTTLSYADVSSFSKKIDLDTYLGEYTISIRHRYDNTPVVDRSGASVSKDRVFVAQTGEVYDRYVFLSYQPKMNVDFPSIAFFTIYQNNNGELYSYYHDQSGISSAEDIESNPYFTIGENWIKLDAHKNKLKGVFYPKDIVGRNKYQITFDENTITFVEKELSGWLVPLKTVAQFKRVK